MQKEMNQYFDRVLKSLAMSRLPSDTKEKADKDVKKITEFIVKTFDGVSQRAGSPYIGGSIKKKTEINLSFDYDIYIPFRQSFSTKESDKNKLKDIRNQVLKVLENRFPGKIRNQRKSLGYTTLLGGGSTLSIDIVPGMEKDKGGYDEQGENKSNMMLFDKNNGQILTTNIRKQIALIKSMNDVDRQIVRLCKCWKYDSEDVNISSYELEFLVYAASKEVGKSETNPVSRLTAILGWLGEHTSEISLYDLGTGQPRKDWLSLNARKNLEGKFRRLAKMLRNPENNFSKIKDAFRGNPKYL